MLASKAQYVTIGGSSNQTPTTAFHANLQRPATATKVQDGAGFASPTKSDFSDGQDELTAIR